MNSYPARWLIANRCFLSDATLIKLGGLNDAEVRFVNAATTDGTCRLMETFSGMLSGFLGGGSQSPFGAAFNPASLAGLFGGAAAPKPTGNLPPAPKASVIRRLRSF